MENSTKKINIPELIPRKVLFGNPDKIQATISPDGKYLAYIAPSTEGVNNVWVKTFGKNDEEMITHEKYRGIQSYFWSYNNEQILFVQDKDGDENFHIYSVTLSSKKIKDITPFEGVKVHS
ncbi:MAG: hypothetical protein JXJ04_18840, partial [Spirochaetales bacterium]|nr:hypothetical protein [Spirochaetales bacterium]